MGASYRTLPDLVGLLKSWVPWLSEPANVSRDFWMPDKSCRVCYECDLQFTLFNRRHHCRLCGRIFCAKCTSNWVPAPSSEPSNPLPAEEREKVRACNYCFMQWEHALSAVVDNGIQFVNLDSGTFSSATGFSFKSGGNCDSTVASMSCSMVGLSPQQSAVTELALDREGVVIARGSVDHDAADMGICDQSLNQSVICTTRDEEEYDAYHLDCKREILPQVNDCYGHIQFNDIHDFGSGKVHMEREVIDTKSVDSLSVRYSVDSQTSEEVQKIVKKLGEPDISDECEESSLYATENVSTEPVDFESNGIIWIPPEPEDEEDEREAHLFYDDDDGDAAGEWGNLHASSSFGSGECRSKDKSNEGHKKVMKTVVDGHFRTLVAQLMQVENLPMDEEDERDTWLEIITSLSWEAANLLKPDTSEGGGMDPGGYVKIKCVASGHRSDSLVVKGIVCKKNVAHRRMTSKIEKPRILVLGGALEYQRVSNALSSFDTLLQQEMDHLKMAVARIDVHQPDVLLVEKSVSRYAQEYLLAKDISVVLNIKKPLLERIARCTGGQIVPSIDHLSSQNLGHCDMFHVDKFVEDHGAAGQNGKKLAKTLMYFEGCPKPLGCTVLLRGANGDELKKVKHVLQYSVFAAHHLALETSFLADEGASLPELPLNSPIIVALPDKPSTIDRSISMIPGFPTPAASEKTQGSPPCGCGSSHVPVENLLKVAISCDRKMETTDSDMLHTVIGTDCINSPIASEQGISNLSSTESFLSYVPLGRSASHSREEPFGEKYVPDCPRDHLTCNGFRPSDALEQGIPDNVPTCCVVDSNQIVSNPVLQPEKKHAPEEPASSKEYFPPSQSDHQSIVVSLSSRCVWKGTVCERSHLFRIKYYGNFDKPLGRFLRDHLFDQSYICRSCDMPSEAHVHCYTHRQGTLTISVKKLPEFLLPGEREGKIWMWHRCLKCPRTNGFPPATRRVVMSDAAWGLSFGKFLELSFSNHAAASRVARCGHSLHRDCLRFYGFGKMVGCFRYASIDVLSVCLPLAKLDFNYENQDWIQQEVNQVINRAELLFSEVHHALSNLVDQKYNVLRNNSVRAPEARHQMTDLEEMLQKEKAEFEESLQKILKKEAKKGQPVVDIFEIYRLRRELLFQSYMWDRRLVFAASLDNQSRCVDADICTSDVDKSLNCNDKCTVSDISVNPSKDLFNSNRNEKPIDTCEDEVSGSHTYEINAIIHGGDVHIAPNNVVENLSRLNGGEYDSVESNEFIPRAISDLFPIMENLSDTLDAAWTGESQSELTRAHSLVNRVSVKLDFEDSGEEHSVSKSSQSPLYSSKGSENMEDAISWLGMPFISFYRSLNKNFLGGSQKLDTLDEYNPVYISSFRESYAQGGAGLLLPAGVNDTVVPVYDDEPASLISYALLSPDYLLQMSDEHDKPKESADSTFSLQSLDSGSIMSLPSVDETVLASWDESLLSSNGSRSLDPPLYTKPIHARVSFADDGPQGKPKYTVTCFFAKRFEALRRICCPSEMDFIRSLSRCKKWGAQGGKSNVFFAKTLDDRFILKQVTKTELESFIKFAPGYFKYLSESISSRSPTCLAKILGIYQVTSKHLKGGKESKMYVLVMENLLFGRNLTRLYDLKGSSRSRYNADCSGRNKVLLDQNLIESMPTCPIFVGNKAKRLLERAVWNDTSFLASIDVMDYSLLVGVDEEKHELVLGIIDFMRQYTWDKHLETWVKASGILGGPKNASPTVISPKQYKKRFRKAMTTYFLMIPDQWSPHTIFPGKSQTDASEENTHSINPTSA